MKSIEEIEKIYKEQSATGHVHALGAVYAAGSADARAEVAPAAPDYQESLKAIGTFDPAPTDARSAHDIDPFDDDAAVSDRP